MNVRSSSSNNNKPRWDLLDRIPPGRGSVQMKLLIYFRLKKRQINKVKDSKDIIETLFKYFTEEEK